MSRELDSLLWEERMGTFSRRGKRKKIKETEDAG